MKYIKYFIILLLVPFIVLAEECDISKITITSMEQSGIEGNTEVISNPTYQDRNINLNLKMYEVGDSITYDMTIKNDSEEDYMIDEDTFKTDSEYIEYSLKTNDNSNVVKANSTKEISLIVTYKNEVDSSLLTNNKFDASNNLKLSLNTSEKEQSLDIITTDNIKESVDPQEVKNPITSVSSKLLIIIILLITLIIAYILITRKNTYIKYLLILLSMVLIPKVYAICTSDIEINTNIQIINPVVYPEGKNKETVVTGDIVKIGTEEFYVVKHEGDDLILLSRYNLKIGSIYVPAGDDYNKIGEYTSNDHGYGLQSSEAKAFVLDPEIYNGVVAYSNTDYWFEKIGTDYPGNYCIEGQNIIPETCAYIYDNYSNLKRYVDTYKTKLEEMGAVIKEARILKLEEIVELGCDTSSFKCTNAPFWVFETSYWLGTIENRYRIWFIDTFNNLGYYYFDNENTLGLRPVIII